MTRSSSNKKRPSRLLTLNKSRTSNKRITAANAKRSPLLSLPPEIRSRIYDYVLYVGIIHVGDHPETFNKEGADYMLSLCQFSEVQYTSTPRFSVIASGEGHEVPPTWPYLSKCMEAHRDCFTTGDTRKSLRQQLHLDLLQTCRQIYHEAVLKPFAINGFQHTCRIFGTKGGELQRLIEAMVPSQIRAIKHLYLFSSDAMFLRHTTIQKFTGLEHLEVKIGTSKNSWNFVCLTLLESFHSIAGVAAVGKLHLKSLRITTEIASDEALSTHPDAVEIVSWQRDLENKLLGSTVGDDVHGVLDDDSVLADS